MASKRGRNEAAGGAGGPGTDAGAAVRPLASEGPDEAALRRFLADHSALYRSALDCADSGAAPALSRVPALRTLRALQADADPAWDAICAVNRTRTLFPSLVGKADLDVLREAADYWLLPTALVARLEQEGAARAGVGSADAVPPSLEPLLAAAEARVRAATALVGDFTSIAYLDLHVSRAGLLDLPPLPPAPEGEDAVSPRLAHASYRASRVAGGHPLGEEDVDPSSFERLLMVTIAAGCLARMEATATLLPLVCRYGFVGGNNVGTAATAVGASGSREAAAAFLQLLEDDEEVQAALSEALEEAGMNAHQRYPRSDMCCGALLRGDVGMLSWLRDEHGLLPGGGSTVPAAMSGEPATLQWLLDNGVEVDYEDALMVALNHGPLPLLEWVLARQPELPASVRGQHPMCRAAANGSVPLTARLRALEPPCPWSPDAYVKAAEKGRLEMLAWLRAQGCPGEDAICEAAAAFGRVDVLRWARAQEPPCAWGADTCDAAARFGRLSALRWLREEGCPGADGICEAAAQGGHLDVLRWARAQEPPCAWGAHVFSTAAMMGRIAVLRWLREQEPPCPWDGAAYELAGMGDEADASRAAVRAWLAVRGCPQ